MEQTTIALFAKIFISIGCQNSDLTYKSACSQGGKQVIEQSNIGRLAGDKEKQIKVQAEDFARAYIFPFIGEKEFVVTVASIDVLAKRQLVYGFKSDISDETFIKATPDTVAVQLTWRLK